MRVFVSLTRPRVSRMGARVYRTPGRVSGMRAFISLTRARVSATHARIRLLDLQVHDVRRAIEPVRTHPSWSRGRTGRSHGRQQESVRRAATPPGRQEMMDHPVSTTRHLQRHVEHHAGPEHPKLRQARCAIPLFGLAAWRGLTSSLQPLRMGGCTAGRAPNPFGLRAPRSARVAIAG
jgi:hypothetical protein